MIHVVGKKEKKKKRHSLKTLFLPLSRLNFTPNSFFSFPVFTSLNSRNLESESLSEPGIFLCYHHRFYSVSSASHQTVKKFEVSTLQVVFTAACFSLFFICSRVGPPLSIVSSEMYLLYSEEPLVLTLLFSLLFLLLFPPPSF